MGTNSPIIRLYDINTVQCYVSSLPSHQHTGPVTSIKYKINNLIYKIYRLLLINYNILGMNQVPGILCLLVEMVQLNYGMLYPINVLIHLKKHIMVVQCAL